MREADKALYRTLRRQQRRLIRRAAGHAAEGLPMHARIAKEVADQFGKQADILRQRLDGEPL